MVRCRQRSRPFSFGVIRHLFRVYYLATVPCCVRRPCKEVRLIGELWHRVGFERLVVLIALKLTDKEARFSYVFKFFLLHRLDEDRVASAVVVGFHSVGFFFVSGS